MKSFSEGIKPRGRHNFLGIKRRITSLRNFWEIVFWGWSTRNELAESGRVAAFAYPPRDFEEEEEEEENVASGSRLHQGGRISGNGEIRPDSSGISSRKSIGKNHIPFLDRISSPYAGSGFDVIPFFPSPYIPSLLLFSQSGGVFKFYITIPRMRIIHPSNYAIGKNFLG